MPHDLPSPWREFLEELDALLKQLIQLHCIGGFAVVVGYGLARSTNDLDYRTLYPFNCLNELQKMAGPGSALAQKHRKIKQLTCIPREREPFLRPMSGQNPDSRRGPLLLTTSR